MNTKYESNGNIMFSVVICLIFLLMSILFVLIGVFSLAGTTFIVKVSENGSVSMLILGILGGCIISYYLNKNVPKLWNMIKMRFK